MSLNWIIEKNKIKRRFRDSKGCLMKGYLLDGTVILIFLALLTYIYIYVDIISWFERRVHLLEML